MRVMEDHPVFDAGRGSHLNADGVVELDAGIMDGRTLMAGAVASVKRIANPITLARRVLHDSPHVFLVGEGAERFAAAAGVPLCDPAELVVERERLLWDARRTTNGGGTMQAFGQGAADACRRRYGGRGGAGRGRQPGRGQLHRRHLFQASRPCGRYAHHRLWVVRRQHDGRGRLHRLGRADHEDRAGQDHGGSDRSAGQRHDAANVAIAYFRHRVGRPGRCDLHLAEGQIGLRTARPTWRTRIAARGCRRS